METIRRAALLLSLMLGSTSVAAQEAPDARLRNATNEFLSDLKQDAELANDPAKVDDLFKARMAPAFDFSRMTQLAMARKWRLASARQQDRLTAEFKSVLLRTYSSTLASYRDCAITYKASHFLPRDTDATVQSEVKQCARAHRLDYEMTRTPDGWKVYDVKLDGASLVTAYRATFTARLRDSGVDGLIRTLAEKNRQSVALAKGSM
jgi:phospholipid transport system substrate-binding protein